MFDETYIYFAENKSDHNRLILMCDIDRPTHFLGSFINWFYKLIVRLTVVPNIEGDKKGIVNTVYSNIAPILQKTKAFNQTNRSLYKLIKYSVNVTLVILTGSIIFGFLTLFNGLLA